MEKETYKAAKDLLAKYDPNSEVVKVIEVFHCGIKIKLCCNCNKVSVLVLQKKKKCLICFSTSCHNFSDNTVNTLCFALSAYK